MLNLALSAVQETLEDIDITGTPLIQKYGGLVFPISIPEEVGKTEGGESILKNKTFPVACGVTFEQCVGQRKYQELVPSSRYKSIAYWEQLGDAVQNNEQAKYAPKGLLSVYDIPARLIVWLNIPKLNINGDALEQCSIAAPVALKIQTALFNNRRWFDLDNAVYENASVEFIFQGQERKDAQNVFGRYTYGSETAKFMLYPYDFISLRYIVRLRINRNCVQAFTLEEAVECAVTP